MTEEKDNLNQEQEVQEPETPEEVQEEPENESTDSEEIKALEEKLKQAEEQVEEYKDRMLRTQADFENFRKRTMKEKQDLAQYTKEEFVKKLLPVLDNMDLALDHADTDNLEAYKKGVELVNKQFKDVLTAEGLNEVETEGVEFNPNFHHGVAVENNPDVEDQHITEVFQKGYQLKDKVLRPAMVKVNQK